MIVYIGGDYVSEEQAMVPLLDRGFLYGDGIFETVRVMRRKPRLLERHLTRFEVSATRLGIVPPGRSQISEVIDELVQRNDASECLARITLSRGTGPRGYSPANCGRPTFAVSLHPLPEQSNLLRSCRVILSSLRAVDPLSDIKSSNKLLHVLARKEADEAGASDAILLSPDGAVRESSSANIFWIKGGAVFTPLADGTLLRGITRDVVLELAAEAGMRVAERRGSAEDLLNAEGVFLTQTGFGISEVIQIDQHPVPRSALVAELHRSYFSFLDRS